MLHQKDVNMFTQLSPLWQINSAPLRLWWQWDYWLVYLSKQLCRSPGSLEMGTERAL